MIGTAFLASVEHLVYMTGFHMDVTTEDVDEVCLVSHEGDGTTHSTAHPSTFCLSPCQIDFPISLKNSFVLATFIASRSSNIDAGRRASSCAIIIVVS